jgi:2-polyprenyl-3-methyl-5-hydroxy-6-metoxy-1,4-benzoquinol methylase
MVGLTINRKPVTNNVFNDSWLNRHPNRKYLTLCAILRLPTFERKTVTVKEHYDNHLGHFYSWMTGDFNTKCIEFKSFLSENLIKPSGNKVALDLGAGHGLQSIPLAEIGFQVFAIDFNQKLLDELNLNAKDLDVTVINDDIRKIETFANKPELIVCCGDTLSHLENIG